MTDSLVKYATTFESTNNLPMSIEIGHGENADLVASFKDDGVDVNLSGYTARAIYQPKSKWGTDEWYECPCEIVDNTVTAHWGNTYDNGDNAVKLFMHLVKDGKLAYPAIYQISLFSTPGFSPSAIEPIPETIDFSQYTLLNAPWVLPSDLSGYATIDDVKSEPLYTKQIVQTTTDNIFYLEDIRSRYVYGIVPNASNNYIDFNNYLIETGKVFDCYIDIDNTTGYSLQIIFGQTSWLYVVDSGVNWNNVKTIPSGTKRRFHISETGIQDTESTNYPVLRVSYTDLVSVS